MVSHFGEYVITIELTEDLNIFHYPYIDTDYDNRNSHSSWAESVISRFTEGNTSCFPKDKKIHGYTLDFFTFNTNFADYINKIDDSTPFRIKRATGQKVYKALPNYREICFFSNYGIQLKDYDKCDITRIAQYGLTHRVGYSNRVSSVPWSKRLTYPLWSDDFEDKGECFYEDEIVIPDDF
jgi:hypothetical protein